MEPLQSAYAFDCVFLFPAGDRPIGRCLTLGAEFARPEVDLLAEQLPAGGVFYDVGANIGTVSIPVAKRRPKARLFAFEAQEAIHRLLQRNVALNDLPNVTTFAWALGERDGTIDFPAPVLGSPTNFAAIGRDAQTAATATVPMHRLDSLDLPPPDLVKIDVEGFDLEVVQGGLEVLRRHQPVVFYEALKPAKTAILNAIMLAEGYRLFWFYAPYVTPGNPRGMKVRAWPQGDMNVLAVPEGIDPVWELPAVLKVDEKPGGRAHEHTYLNRYGYTL